MRTRSLNLVYSPLKDILKRVGLGEVLQCFYSFFEISYGSARRRKLCKRAATGGQTVGGAFLSENV